MKGQSWSPFDTNRLQENETVSMEQRRSIRLIRIKSLSQLLATSEQRRLSDSTRIIRTLLMLLSSFRLVIHSCSLSCAFSISIWLMHTFCLSHLSETHWHVIQRATMTSSQFDIQASGYEAMKRSQLGESLMTKDSGTKKDANNLQHKNNFQSVKSTCVVRGLQLASLPTSGHRRILIQEQHN